MKNSTTDEFTIIVGKTGDGSSKTLSDAQKQFCGSSFKANSFDEPADLIGK
jgi:hypothetical protein